MQWYVKTRCRIMNNDTENSLTVCVTLTVSLLLLLLLLSQMRTSDVPFATQYMQQCDERKVVL